jgi:hypothetical protein
MGLNHFIVLCSLDLTAPAFGGKEKRGCGFWPSFLFHSSGVEGPVLRRKGLFILRGAA